MTTALDRGLALLEQAVRATLDAFDRGLEFADALHLARSERASGFAPFDRRLAKRAKGLELMPPVELLV